jgi:microcystin-dependent protein
MAPTALGLVGSNQPHENMMPFVAVNFIIALNGLFPTQS